MLPKSFLLPFLSHTEWLVGTSQVSRLGQSLGLNAELSWADNRACLFDR